jgi:hypothetical protein
MRKRIFCVIFIINLSLVNAQAVDPYYVDNIDKQYFGVYLPTEYIRSIELTKNHSFSLSLNRENSYHDVLIVMEHMIYSDFKFCDQYAILSDEVKEYIFFVNSNFEILIQDNNGELYKKISENTDNYYGTISYYIGKIILENLNTKKIGLLFSANDVIVPFLNNQIYEIILYEKGIYLKANLVLKNKNNNEWIYIVIRDTTYTFYEGKIQGLQILKTNKVVYELEI